MPIVKRIADQEYVNEALASYTETDPTVPAWAKAASKPTYTASEVGADASGTASNLVSAHNTTSNTHSDIREQISQLSTNKADKSAMTLGVHTDGFVYLFINGAPQGNGLDIKADVIEGDVFGYVDENNVIVLNGALAEGTYTIKYEMEDGSKVNIGDLVLDTNVYYTVTNTLTNCTNSNGATEAVEGESYSATITAKSGYELKSVTVTMGGTAVSVSNGKISIANVTGNIVITAVAEEVTVEIVNLIPISTNADGSLYKGAKGESGYKLKTRVKLSNGDEAVHHSSVCTGFMPCKYNDTLYIKGITVVNDPNQTNEAICFYNSNHAFIASVHAGKAFGAVSGGVASVKFNETGTGKTEINSSAGIAYFRLSANTIDSNSVITINQPL